MDSCENILIGLERYELPLKGKRVIPREGTIISVIVGGKELSFIKINGVEHSLPAKVKMGNIIDLAEGDVCQLKID